MPVARALLEKAGLTQKDLDLRERNEAFVAQGIACNRGLRLAEEKLDVEGGAIALGHPIGATGARILTTFLHAMGERAAKRGVGTLCVSGGLGLAALIERV